MFARICLVPMIAALAACATDNGGWTGTGAQPFDSALAECQTSASSIADEQQRQAAVEDCMAKKGWTRPAS